ncbi:hypothetical protein ElyMa_001511500 [Elysia marginata]|uniref:Uncharacterized protein n=1 Tax=Elysia marginata TaxID=1093978 RepID=A0AAV4J6S0_9GAST|nr:hypothetical protein ElyMa_001511500 [Elysia marginata]
MIVYRSPLEESETSIAQVRSPSREMLRQVTELMRRWMGANLPDLRQLLAQLTNRRVWIVQGFRQKVENILAPVIFSSMERMCPDHGLLFQLFLYRSPSSRFSGRRWRTDREAVLVFCDARCVTMS